MNARWRVLVVAYFLGATITSGAPPFEGRIEAVVTRGDRVTPLLYTVGIKTLRLEIVDKKAVEPVDLVDLKSGALTILYPHNRSFIRTKQQPAVNVPAPPFPSPGAQIPAMPPIPAPPQRSAELKSTGKKQTILGFACEQFEITERGETIAVWATTDLVPFQPYARNAGVGYGPRVLEEQWAERLTAKKLFPLRAIMHDETPNERFRFEVKAITLERTRKEDSFQPPADYIELHPPSL